MSVSRLSTKTEQEKVNILIYIMGEKSEEIIVQFTEAPKDLADCLTKFENHFIPRRNVIFERFKFNSRTQKPGDSVWVIDIRQYGNIIQICEEPRSYIVRTDQGTYRHNCWHLINAPYYNRTSCFIPQTLAPENGPTENTVIPRLSTVPKFSESQGESAMLQDPSGNIIDKPEFDNVSGNTSPISDTSQMKLSDPSPNLSFESTGPSRKRNQPFWL
ncbi:hypothetical protein NQ314_016528 [Rhamnusium bicolor]|uniref:Uncharacterized protein n=1 Tax=Rhamnusium bicolor TaxID=1586634 RepID=A0AAV8WWK3_9CUCU|nr:hypothetical protein NQ314_016528 [Rhamnusium bicolor]